MGNAHDLSVNDHIRIIISHKTVMTSVQMTIYDSLFHRKYSRLHCKWLFMAYYLYVTSCEINMASLENDHLQLNISVHTTMI